MEIPDGGIAEITVRNYGYYNDSVIAEIRLVKTRFGKNGISASLDNMEYWYDAIPSTFAVGVIENK